MAASGGRGLAYLMAEGDGFRSEGVGPATALVLRYAAMKDGALDILVNGQPAGRFSFSATGAWTGSYRDCRVEAAVPAKATVEMRFVPGGQGANVDYLQLE